jgi:hypothetical protein
VLYLRGNSCTGNQLSCNDDTAACATASGANHGSRITPPVDHGKARYVVRSFPLEAIHADAFKAHAVARCADEQGGC